MSGGEPATVILDGSSLSIAALARIARDPGVAVACESAALARVERCRREIEAVAEAYRAGFERFDRGETAEPPVQDYGVTTGFGEFKDVPVPPGDLERLQRNVLLGHAVGVGESASADDPASYFPAEVVRATLVIRLNAFLKGHSGVRVELARAVEAMINRGVVPLVPTRGSLGSSGDLCPLAHLFAVFLGVGRYYAVGEAADLTRLSRDPRAWRPAAALAADLGAAPPVPSFKEGLALCNGATFSTALLALAVHDAEALANAADAAAALTLEAACGCARAFDPRIHRARGLPGQCDSAANIRALVAGSRLVDAAPAVQDAYSLRCAPAVHGASRDAIAFARMVAEREVNAATDNPLFFPAGEGASGGDPDEEPWDHRFRANWPPGYQGDRRRSYSAGNFHGQPVGMAADFLTIALAELADISERRTQMLLDRHHNRGLPANLVARRGLNSGFMLAQYSAASLVSENKVLAHPASVDSIPTSANTEDHVAMATHAARKLRTVLANGQAVLAIELLAAAQAVEWRVGMEYGPEPRSPASTGGAGAGVSAGGSSGALAAARAAWRQADDEAERFRQATLPGRRDAVAARLGAGSRAVYEGVRRVAEPLLEDRSLATDVGRVRELLEDRSLVTAADGAVEGGLRPIAAFG